MIHLRDIHSKEYCARVLCEVTPATGKAAPIFNNTWGGGDRKRIQCKAPSFPATDAMLHATKARVMDVLCKALHWDENNTFGPSSVLVSKPGCKEQMKHTDYEVPVEGFGRCRPRGFPCGVIIALQNGTKLISFGRRGSRRQRRQVTELAAGDVLIFHGDMVHAGAAYDDTNVRLHMYVDSSIYPRVENTVF